MNKIKFYNSLKGTFATKNGELKKVVPIVRWNLAHVSEEEFWSDFTTESLSEKTYERYERKAKILLSEWQKYIKIDGKTKILQIGCGPEDVINHFKKVRKFSIDPLADFYKKKFDFDYDSSNLIKASGEKIPFPDNYFDVVILINVLDHTHIPEKVLYEINRVLKDDGIFHFENYIFQKKFLQLAKAWEFFKNTFSKEIYNIHHPYMFTRDDLKILISEKFNILYEELVRDIGNQDTLVELEENLKKEKKLTIRFPLLLGLVGAVNYTCICKKLNRGLK